MKENRDILGGRDLRRRPYSVPSGYFEGLQERLMSIPQEHGLPLESEVHHPGIWMRIRPFVALAASFALILAIGSVVLHRPFEDVDDSTYEQLLFADMIPHVDPYSEDFQDDTELTSDELLEYLMCSNVQPYSQDMTNE